LAVSELELEPAAPALDLPEKQPWQTPTLSELRIKDGTNAITTNAGLDGPSLFASS
jgi:hypothetical protein